MQYKFTRVYLVQAASKAEAAELLKKNPQEYLEYEGWKINPEGAGWKAGFQKQFTGK